MRGGLCGSLCRPSLRVCARVRVVCMRTPFALTSVLSASSTEDNARAALTVKPARDGGHRARAGSGPGLLT